MKLNTAGVVAVVAMVALAGCAGFAPGGSQDASPTGDSPETTDPAETMTSTETMDDDDGSTADSGVVRFYISDEENAIGDFEHLNVTITEVGFQAAGDADDGDAEEPEETPENSTVITSENVTDTPDNETEVPDEENDPADDGYESDGWIEHDVDDRTFDLTRLQGANASLLEEFDVPEGSYNKVFVHVDGINGTLENGESVNVKLPSEKLQITQSFTVEANDSVDFVFDITVHRAGNTGKYILTPVISESGTDVPIEDVDEDTEDERDDESEEREDEESDVETELNASFAGAVERGTNATIQVSANGSAVANATVLIEGDIVGETNQFGELTILVPEDAAALEVVIESGDAETELDVEFEDATPG